MDHNRLTEPGSSTNTLEVRRTIKSSRSCADLRGGVAKQATLTEAEFREDLPRRMVSGPLPQVSRDPRLSGSNVVIPPDEMESDLWRQRNDRMLVSHRSGMSGSARGIYERLLWSAFNDFVGKAKTPGRDFDEEDRYLPLGPGDACKACVSSRRACSVDRKRLISSIGIACTLCEHDCLLVEETIARAKDVGPWEQQDQAGMEYARVDKEKAEWHTRMASFRMMRSERLKQWERKKDAVRAERKAWFEDPRANPYRK